MFPITQLTKILIANYTILLINKFRIYERLKTKKIHCYIYDIDKKTATNIL